MALNQKRGESKPRFLIPEDTYIGKLQGVLDLGEHDSGYPDKEGNPKIITKMNLTFELQDVNLEDGRPAVISQEYTSSLFDLANFTPVAEALLGGTNEAKEFIKDPETTVAAVLKKTIGKPVLVTVVHGVSKKTGNTFAKIGSVSRLPSKDAKSVTPLVNPPSLVLEVNDLTEEQKKALPQFLLEKIASRMNKPVTSSENPF